MIYSDDELKRWWKGLTNQDKSELIQTVFEKAYSPRMRQMATDWQKKMQAGQELGAFELQALRKWAK